MGPRHGLLGCIAILDLRVFLGLRGGGTTPERALHLLRPGRKNGMLRRLRTVKMMALMTYHRVFLQCGAPVDEMFVGANIPHENYSYVYHIL